MIPLGKRAGWARALAGFLAFGLVAAVPVIVKTTTSEESAPVLAVSSRGGTAAGGGTGDGAAGAAATGSGAGDGQGGGGKTGGASAGGAAKGGGGGAGTGDGGPGKTPAGGTGQTPSPGRKPDRVPARTPSAGGGGGAVTATIAGDTVDTQYGPMQFAIDVRDGRVVAIQDLKLPGDTRSLEINNPATPKLHAQTVRTQAAHVDTISGATITCQAYTISIQSALDRM